MKEPRFRHELKYLCSDAELAMLRVRLTGLMRPDPHAGPDGCYLIRSVYMDTLYDSCRQANEDGVDPREKWRIRSYNRSADRISLECKRRESGMILKKSCLLTPDQFRDLMEGRPLPVSDRNPALLNRFLIERRTRFLTPRVIVSYQRRPFICPQGNVRVTFDRNIAASASFDRFFEHSLPQRPILQAGMQLLEVKYDDYLPDHIYHAVQMTSMRQETFSKYYLCRHYYHGGREHVI